SARPTRPSPLLVRKHEASLKLRPHPGRRVFHHPLLVRKHEASLKHWFQYAVKRAAPPLLVRKHEASLKQARHLNPTALDEVDSPRAKARGLIEASPARGPRTAHWFSPRAKARGLIEARARRGGLGDDRLLSSCESTRPH